MSAPAVPKPPERPSEVAAQGLLRDLGELGARQWLRRGAVVLVLVAGVGGVGAWRKAHQPPPPPRYSAEKIERRDIKEEVQSTGTVKPLTEVTIGAQVSGRVIRVHADFNSHVKKGDLLAEIDPSLLGAQVSQQGAQLSAAQAAEKRSSAQLEASAKALARLEKLVAEGLAAQAEVDQARGTRDVALADVASARAQIRQVRATLTSARTNLAYARIYSPIDGIVVNRAVEPGQTVASSFSAPTMFVIAQDLTQMQVLAEIDEADVGRLGENMEADVVVDAFPGTRFSGKVTQLRFSPNATQGVVTYSAKIEVGNPDLKLRPGMTATVTVKARAVQGVLAARNSALRFRPLPPKDDEGKPIPGKPPEPLPPDKARLYVLESAVPGQEQLSERVVGIGLTDGTWSQLLGDAPAEGVSVVTEQHEDKKQKRFGLF